MKYLFISIILLASLTINAQESRKISGFVKDSANNEALIGAYIYDRATNKAVLSNNYGYFSITLPKSSGTIQASYVGYKSKSIEIRANSDSLLNIRLAGNNTLGEVVVYANSNRLTSAQTGLEIIQAKTVTALPVVMGESDLTRTLLLTPGVSFGTENTSGYFVRGGNSDQNLLLIDNVPVYNAYHLYGFFSVFNTDAINNAKFYKGGCPARYGGRLSSVLDIAMKEGNDRKYSGNVTMGMISSKFMLEGPIAKGKTSFIITGRRSMMDVYPLGITDALSQVNGMDKTKRGMNLPFYFFYDLNGKINHTFSPRSRLFLSIYSGRDNYDYKNEVLNYTNSLKWGNLTSSLRWNYIFSDHMFSNFTFYYSGFSYLSKTYENITSGDGSNLYNYHRQLTSAIEDYSAKADFDYTISNHSIKFGSQFVLQNIKPGVTSFYKSGATNGTFMDTAYRFDRTVYHINFYAEDNFQLSKKISANAGLHQSLYKTKGKLYLLPQPRVTLNYQPVNWVAIKTSYGRMAQSLHQLSSSVLGGPADMWVPATKTFRPEIASQYAVGLSFALGNKYSIEVEAYTKNMKHLIMYKEGASYAGGNSDWEDLVKAGTGKSKGIEVSLKKDYGRLTGWVSYTLSKSVRQFTGINRGEEFPFSNDRRHNVAIAGVYRFNPKNSIGLDWVYATGNAVTVSNTMIFNELVGGDLLMIYNSFNGYRMPAYHRLDICYTHQNILFKRINYSYSIGAYNVYNRKNPYCIIDSFEGITYQSLFPILPYLNISIKF